MPTFPSIRELLAQYDNDANKRLGQHFLYDISLTDKIVRNAGDLKEVHVIEIGPGPGGLTQSLLKSNALSITAIETDARFVAMLNDYLVPHANHRLTILQDDALTSTFEQNCPSPKCIVANLPYNISTQLIFKWLENIDQFQSLTLMFQKEVADRLASAPGSKSYGRISVLTQRVCNVETIMTIAPSAFYPPPKVTSAVLHITPKKTPTPVNNLEILDKVLRATFGQRRKTLRKSLKSVCDFPEQLLKDCNLQNNDRPEALSVEKFCDIANKL